MFIGSLLGVNGKIRMQKNMSNVILTVPEAPTVTFGSMEAVINGINPDVEFCIKGKVTGKDVSWNKRGICRQHPAASGR
jgi:hypothetical protein